MDDQNEYRITLRGIATETELNSLSTVQVNMVPIDPENLELACTTDQSGLLGLLRQLHFLGFYLLTVSRIDDQQGR